MSKVRKILILSMNIDIVCSTGHKSRGNSISSIDDLNSEYLSDPFGAVNAILDTEESKPGHSKF